MSHMLKIRFMALHGKERRKNNFKKEMNLADSDETPDEFNSDDSDYD